MPSFFSFISLAPLLLRQIKNKISYKRPQEDRQHCWRSPGEETVSVSSERPRAKLHHSCRGRHGCTAVSFFGRRKRKIYKQQLTPTVLSLRKTLQWVENFELNQTRPGLILATKNHQVGLGDSGDESDVSVPGFETDQQSAPHIQFEIPRQPKQGNAERVIFGSIVAQGLSYGAWLKCSAVFISLLDD